MKRVLLLSPYKGDIEANVATYFGVTPADIHSTRRTRTVSLARRKH